MQENSTITAERTHGSSKLPNYIHVYSGKFKDLNPDLRTAGVLTYPFGETVDLSIRQNANSAPVNLMPNQAKFTHWRSPGLSEIQLHYGHANDPKDYEYMTHGMRSDDKSFTTKDCINPKLASKFDFLKNEMSERMYISKKTKPLGRVPKGVLPHTIDPYSFTCGHPSLKSDSAKECINPDKKKHIVELEASDKHDMYVFSHKDYEPGEQKNRLFVQPYDINKRFGVQTLANHDGRLTKKCLDWLPTKSLEKRTQADSKVLDNFRENHTSQIGQKIDPNRETRFLGPDHIFGLSNNTDLYSAADVITGRPDEKALKGKDRERAYVAVLRHHLCRYNYVKFKSLVDAFKFYDKNKDGNINKDELNEACAQSGFPVANDLLDSLFVECDHDKDGSINFLEFSNFLCFKDSMKNGFDSKKSESNSEEKEIKDDDGRVLLKISDLVPKNNISVNELVPKTLVKQLDVKVGNWKTQYDIFNEAPTRLEPLKKRVYGIPSIRNDLVAPDFRKIQDKKNYGNDGTAWTLVAPSVFAMHGVYESDVLKPRSKDEIRSIFKNVGYEIPQDLFESTWHSAKALNPYGEVSVEEFRSALEQFKIKNPIELTT